MARLKGGDPFIFGRAAEEMAALQAAGIAVEVVPGVTAAHACAARIGLPVTLRERVRQFSVVTGATADGAPDLDWQALAAPETAFAIYMGVGNAPLMRAQPAAAGADPETPVVIVENGTREDERAFATTLADLTNCVAVRAIAGPAVIFVGLDWADAGLQRPETVDRASPAPPPPGSQPATMSKLPTLEARHEQDAPQISVLTANRLGDGIVVFLDSRAIGSRAWRRPRSRARPRRCARWRTRGAYDAARNLVVEPYLVEVREAGGRLTPIRTRERVRVVGPSILDDVPGYVLPLPSAFAMGRGSG